MSCGCPSRALAGARRRRLSGAGRLCAHRRLPLPRDALTAVSLCLVAQDVRSTTVMFLLLKIPTLKIKTLSRKEVFEANLKTECDLWHLLVKEMWAGKRLADAHKVGAAGGAARPAPFSRGGAC